MKTFLNTCFALLLLASPIWLMANEDEDVRDLPTRERISVGGNIGLQISNINTMVIISPMVSYRLTNRITPGLSLTYQYYRDAGWGNMAGFTAVTHIYGGAFFTRYSITRQIYAHAEFEALNLDSQMGWKVNPDNDSRFWEYNYFFGGGYRTPLGARAWLNMTLLYNFNTNSVVYYQNPIFRIGVNVRL